MLMLKSSMRAAVEQDPGDGVFAVRRYGADLPVGETVQDFVFERPQT
ncbi:MAG: hypothetical protein MZV70_17660 [Desulfobacterales bacterium]|nr:hypothetical protein [Desulfobacterales bacterium]